MTSPTINQMVDCWAIIYIAKFMFTDDTMQLDAIFSALSDKTRRAILLRLLEADMNVKDIASSYNMSLAAISKHIQILRRAGLITQQQKGRYKLCRLELDAFKPAAFWIESYGQFLDENFDALEHAIEQLEY